MSWDDGLLWNAVSEAVAPIAQLETQLEPNKLEKKIRDYFSKAAKGLDFNNKHWTELIDDYADKAYSAIFCGLWDKEWLNQADFLMCVDAGVKDHFPPKVLEQIDSQAAFEQTVLAASDRAFDEQRFWTFRWETVQRIVQGKTTQKRVREALDAARAEAYQAVSSAYGQDGKVKQFLEIWIRNTLLTYRQAAGDFSSLEVHVAVELFHSLIQEGGLPLWLAEEEGVPQDNDPWVKQMVEGVFEECGAPVSAGLSRADYAAGMGAKGKGKGKGPAFWGPPSYKAAKGDWGAGFGWEGKGGGGKPALLDWGVEPPAKRWKGAW